MKRKINPKTIVADYMAEVKMSMQKVISEINSERTILTLEQRVAAIEARLGIY